MRIWTNLGLAALVLTAACESSGPTEPLTQPVAANPQGSWELSVFDLSGGQSLSVPNPSQYTLDLGDDGRANLRADCNVCNGTYRVDGASIEFGLMACTLAACPPGSLERDYLGAIGEASSFELADGQLAIVYSGGVLRFTQR